MNINIVSLKCPNIKKPKSLISVLGRMYGRILVAFRIENSRRGRVVFK